MSLAMRVAASAFFFCAAPALVGCGGYATPGRAADLSVLGVAAADAAQTDPAVSTELARRPLARFPTGVAVARIQAPGYRSPTADGWGRGAYSLVSVRDVEDLKQVGRLAALPGVHAIAPVGRLLVPQELNTDVELRNAAAKLRADVLLVYTLDTTFTVDDKAAPLTVVTLGLSPNHLARVVCTASAVLMDTRNGYVYGVAEGTSRQGQLASAWTSESAVDDASRRAEREAFRSLVDELEQTWDGVYETYGRRPQPLPPQADRWPQPDPPSPSSQHAPVRAESHPNRMPLLIGVGEEAAAPPRGTSTRGDREPGADGWVRQTHP